MSNEVLTSKFDEIVKRLKEEFNEIVESERAKIVNGEVDEAYDTLTEKQRVVQVSDIIHLNVGGQKFTTKRSTLCQVEGSLLAGMFSGRWQDGIERDQDGVVFLDYNPEYFNLILDYLRAKKIESAENPAVILRDISEGQVKNFSAFVEYLGLALGDESVPVDTVVSSHMFNLHSRGITLEEGKKVAAHAPERWKHDYVLSENVYQQEVAHFKLKLESFKDNWLFIGVVNGNSVVQRTNNSHEWPGSYGWALGTSGQVWKAGACLNDNSLKNLSKQGDTVELVVDCDAGKLSLRLPTGDQFRTNIPKFQTWRLNVDLYSPSDKIRIIDE